MFNGFKIAAINMAKGIGGAAVLGAGFAIGASVALNLMSGMGNMARRLDNKLDAARNIDRGKVVKTETASTSVAA